MMQESGAWRRIYETRHRTRIQFRLVRKKVSEPMDFSSQPQNVKIEIAWLGECWNILKSRIGEYIAMGLITMVISYAISFALQIPMQVLFGMSSATGSGEAALGMMFAGIFAQMIGSFVTNAITYTLWAGIIIFTLKLLRGEAARFEDLFAGFKNFGAYFLAGILYALATMLGLLACLIGSLFIAALLMFMVPLIYDRNLSAVDAFKESIEMLKGQWAMAGLYLFVSALFAFVGFFACCIGIIVTMPIMYIAQALAYHKFVGSPSGEAYLSPSGYPRDPSTMGNMPEAPASWPGQDAPKPPSDPEPPTAPEPPANVDSDATTFENTVVDGEEPPADPNRPQA